jgi:integrase
MQSQIISAYITNTEAMSQSTARAYEYRLNAFDSFVSSKYHTSTDNLIEQIKEGHEDPYKVLSSYVAYLQGNRHLSSLTLKQELITVKNLLEYNDIDISPRKFKLKVKVPKVIRKSKEALDKEDIVNILNSCSDIRLKTYVMLLAATGMRATEALSIRIMDIDFKANPVKLFVRGEYTKTKVDRTVFLTDELSKQLVDWLDYKYRTRRVCHHDNFTHRTITEYKTPKKDQNDLVLAVHQATPDSLYLELSGAFGKTLDRIGMGTREEEPSVIVNNNTQNHNNNKANGDSKNRNRFNHRKITLHSFRRFVKSTISDLGYSDFSEWFIGHDGSTYYRKKESEKAEIFRKVAPYLTFLDFAKLEANGADVETKLQDKDKQIQSMNEKYELLQSQIQTIMSALSNADQSSKNELSKQLLQTGFFDKTRQQP